MDIAIDNSVIEHFLRDSPKTEKENNDIGAFKKILELAQNGIFELGGPISTLWIEIQNKAGDSRRHFIEELREIIKIWPVVDPDQTDTQKKVRCLHELIQGKNQTDTQQLVLIAKLSQARHFISMDYRFVNRFNDVEHLIAKRCNINIFVMTPSEFMMKYNNREIKP